MAKLGKPAAAIVIMAAIIGVLMVLCTPRTASRRSVVDSPVRPAWPAAPRTTTESVVVRVLGPQLRPNHPGPPGTGPPGLFPVPP